MFLVPSPFRKPPEPPRPLRKLLATRDAAGCSEEEPWSQEPTQEERDCLKNRPPGKVVGYQQWAQILFVHWAVPAELLRPLVHRSLSIDRFDGTAWISMTPFTLLNGRLRGMPPLPGVSTFHELNVRTYVHRAGRDPGVWFFSLNAGSLASTLLARAAFALPYYWCKMRRSETDRDFHYQSVRRRTLGRARFEAEWSVLGDEATVKPRSLGDFLLNRFSLYAPRSKRWILFQRVHHAPWRAAGVSQLRVEQTMSDFDGLPSLGPPALAHFASGVDVDFFVPRLVRAQDQSQP
jgi:hypothetical protein